MFELKLVTDSRVINLNSIDHDENLISLTTAHTNLSLGTKRAGAANRNTWYVSQDIGHINQLTALNLVTIDDGE